MPRSTPPSSPFKGAQQPPPSQPPRPGYSRPSAPARRVGGEIDTFAQAAPYGLLIALLGGFARAVSPIVADGAGGIGLLIALGCSVVGLVRIYTSGGSRVGAKRCWATLAAVGVMFAIAIPNFVRYRARAMECGVLGKHVAELGERSKQMKALTEASKDNPIAVADGLSLHAKGLADWATVVQGEAAGMEAMGETAKTIATEVASLSVKYVALANGVRGGAENIEALGASATASEKKLSELIISVGGVCSGSSPSASKPVASTQAPVPEPAVPATPPAPQGGALWYETMKLAMEAHKKSAAELPKALDVMAIDSKEEIADRKKIVSAFRASNQRLIDLMTDPEAFVRKELVAKGTDAARIEATIGAMKGDVESQRASLDKAVKVRKIDDLIAVKMIAQLDVLGKNLGQWHVDGNRRINFHNPKVEKDYERHSKAISKLEEEQESLR